LYWLAKDFFEKANDEVAGPQAHGLSDIRNHIEHKYLRVTAVESPTVPPDDLAFMVSREQFERKTMHLLKLARSALIYLAIGVGFEERRDLRRRLEGRAPPWNQGARDRNRLYAPEAARRHKRVPPADAG
jgi:LA2681-like HEPN